MKYNLNNNRDKYKSGGEYFLGTDIGGTFSDLILFDENGQIECRKVKSTPNNPAQSTLDGVDDLLGGSLDSELWSHLRQTHSSTIATNALIERKGGVIGLVVNEGFRDILELQRLSPPRPGRFDSRRPQPLVPRRLVAEVGGRMDARGRELTPLDEERLISGVEGLVRQGAAVVAVVFLHSYLNPKHEEQAREVIRRHFPELGVELSSAVWPQAREYERATLTVMNCFVRPIVHAYIDGLVVGMAERGVATEVRLARSNGGAQLASTVRELPIVTALSGPSAGVAAAATPPGTCRRCSTTSITRRSDPCRRRSSSGSRSPWPWPRSCPGRCSAAM